MKRVAFITGGGKGIGEAIAYALARQGVRVAVAARTRSDVERVADSIRKSGGDSIAVVCDATKPDSIASAIEQTKSELGSIDILINNAGASASAKFVGHSDELWHQMIDANLNSTYYVTKAVAPMMIESKWGRIINIASIASKIGGKYVAAYTAAKHGVLGLTRALAVELAAYNITVNAICPGYVDTPMTDRSIENIAARTKSSAAEARAALEKLSPQNRLIAPEEIAAVVMLLISEDARGITGQAINVDGGQVQF
jgi:NAD(P)-dependent dehydrogenase (short-subunit alcohol dehydrogenase family)